MARTNMGQTRIKPETSELLALEVLRRERLSPSFVRVTVGRGDVARFSFLGFDQWFRLFLPVSEASLSRLPSRLDALSYLRFLTISKTDRPVLRNYTVAGYRPDGAAGPELDVDFVLHGSADDGTAGPAATWAETCAPGDALAILDEGVAYNPPAALSRRVVLVADETALPAAAGILAAMPHDAVVGTAVLEVPDAGDRRELVAPEGVEVRWVVRAAGAAPGRAALDAVRALPAAGGPFFGWVAGEQALPTAVRRHWVAAGVPKTAIAFTGYWKLARH